MESTIIKNDKQLFFNQIKGKICEINDAEEFCNIVLEVGHENIRNISFVTKKKRFEEIKPNFELNEKVIVKYYLSSRKKHDRWYTTATILDINKDL
jgi:hypothetical protein